MVFMTKRILATLGTGLLLCCLLCAVMPPRVHAEVETSRIRWSISCNVDHYFSPLRFTNRDLKDAGLPEITSTMPQIGLELARFKYDMAGNAKHSLSFLYVYWQGKGTSGEHKSEVRFHEFLAKVRVHVLPHLAVSPFVGGGLGFQTGTIETYRPYPAGIAGLDDDYTGGVLTLLAGIGWQNKSKGGVFRLEGGYRHMPSASMAPSSGTRINTSCWFLGATVGMKM